MTREEYIKVASALNTDFQKLLFELAPIFSGPMDSSTASKLLEWKCSVQFLIEDYDLRSKSHRGLRKEFVKEVRKLSDYFHEVSKFYLVPPEGPKFIVPQKIQGEIGLQYVEIWKYFIDLSSEVSVEVNEHSRSIDESNFVTSEKNAEPSPTQEFQSTNYNSGLPVFDIRYRSEIYTILQSYFNVTDQNILKHLLEVTVNLAKPLLFLESANKLADAFKQLYDCKVLTGCTKLELETWIRINFNYMHRGKVKSFDAKYLNDLISTRKDSCNNPIIDVRNKDGMIQLINLKTDKVINKG